jgi:hypothetical protein
MYTYLTVVGLEKLHHDKRRPMNWIRLYNSILDDFEFSRLTDAQRFQLIALMLLATRMDNELPDDPQWLRNRISGTTDVELEPLIVRGFLKRETVQSTASKSASRIASVGASYKQTGTEGEQSEINNSAMQNQSTSSASNNSHPSRFSYDQILDYVRNEIARGKQVKNPVGLTLSLMQSGKADGSINSFLFDASKNNQTH